MDAFKIPLQEQSNHHLSLEELKIPYDQDYNTPQKKKRNYFEAKKVRMSHDFELDKREFS